jgi:hypothetical protein
MKTRQVLGAALAVVFAVAACGSQKPLAATGTAASAGTPAATGVTASAGTAATNGSVASAGADPTCALAPPQMVSAALGGTVGKPSQAINRTSVATVVVCSYTTTGSEDVTIRFQNKEDASGFAEGRSNFAAGGQSVKDIGGFEDQAYVSTISLGGGSAITTLVARKGTLEIEVASQAILSREEALESKIFAAP